MGRDKAMLELDGKTLLARAVETLRSVERFHSVNGSVQVTVCGDREALEGADRAIIDRYPECGPLGGIEAALRDLQHDEWAFFVPVDMPLLSVWLLEELFVNWSKRVEAAMPPRACLVEVGGRPQPLVSMVHRSVHGLAREALETGQYKVVPVLQSAEAYYTSFDQEILRQDQDSNHGERSDLNRGISSPKDESSNQTRSSEETEKTSRSEDRLRETYEQFINVNTEADLIRVATLLRQKGSRIQH